MIARARRWLRRRGASSPLLWHHPSFRLPVAGIETATGMDSHRADDVLTWAMYHRAVREGHIRTPDEISWEDVARVHDAAYLGTLDDPVVQADIVGVDPEVVSVESMLDLWRRATGATVEATRHALTHNSRSMVLLGGFHHAAPSRGSGFCAINDLAIAIARVRAEGHCGRIAVVDLDAHPPDGLVACVADDPAVLVISVGVESEWTSPSPTRAEVHDLRVPPATSDAEYLSQVDVALTHLNEVTLVFYIAGADPLQGDPLGGLAVTELGLLERDRRVFQAIGRRPTVVCPGGGYLDDSWRVLANTLGVMAGARVPVRSGWNPKVHRSRFVASRLDPVELGDNDWLSDNDLLASLGVPGSASHRRFLGYYTRHGLEYALTEYGYLPALRQMGFRDLQLSVEAEEMPHRLRITAEVVGDRPVLVDLSVSIQHLEPSFRVLFIEWLELRDPRLAFTRTRPKLPGQQAPGLGLAEETGMLMLRAAERLELDGVGFVPSHYHVAAMAGAGFEVIDPVRRGHFRALRSHLAEVPLRQATQILAGPGVPTFGGPPVGWQPSWMVIPQSTGLQAHMEQGRQVAAAAEAELTARLEPVAAPPDA